MSRYPLYDIRLEGIYLQSPPFDLSTMGLGAVLCQSLHACRTMFIGPALRASSIDCKIVRWSVRGIKSMSLSRRPPPTLTCVQVTASGHGKVVALCWWQCFIIGCPGHHRQGLCSSRPCTRVSHLSLVHVSRVLHWCLALALCQLTLFSLWWNTHANEAPVPCSLILVSVGVHQGLAYPGGHMH